MTAAELSKAVKVVNKPAERAWAVKLDARGATKWESAVRASLGK